MAYHHRPPKFNARPIRAYTKTYIDIDQAAMLVPLAEIEEAMDAGMIMYHIDVLDGKLMFRREQIQALARNEILF